MKKLAVGILAHVDAGKTTLSEAMLYLSGAIRKLGRVDKKDAFLDTYELEKQRGITIFSKQAVFRWNEIEFTLLDTPGHVDFSAEMERTLQVLDYAILVVSGPDGIQGHTRTLWQLLARYDIPTFLFINKMDLAGERAGECRTELIRALQEQLNNNFVDFSEQGSESFYENLAVCGENALEQFLENGRIELNDIRSLIQTRSVFPCFFGSALRLEGVEEFLKGLEAYMTEPEYLTDFSAKIFKIGRDSQGNRLTYLKITGGTLKVRDLIDGEKVSQIRIYSGEKFEAVTEAGPGTVCAVLGLTKTAPGRGLGAEAASMMPVLEPVLTCRVLLPSETDAASLFPKLIQLEEEEPELHIAWQEEKKEIHAQIMGEIQMEILKSRILERFGVQVEFGERSIVYKETITDTVEGVGHFEPLRHYAEVHLLLEPGENGSGLTFASACSEDILDRNWQRLILTHLEEREHKGVLTGSAITDMRITLMSGRAHQKHTEGGDFRQAVYRAVRQGLRQAESLLLEPYYDFRLEVPERLVGRAMTDIERMQGTFEPPMIETGRAVLSGRAPVACMDGYHTEVISYTGGIGTLVCTSGGYGPCHNTEEVVTAAGYDPDSDLNHPCSSVFCAHGAGFVVDWDEVKEYMHLESCLSKKQQSDALERMAEAAARKAAGRNSSGELWLGTEEIDAILANTYGANKKEKSGPAARRWGSRHKTQKADSSPASAHTYRVSTPGTERPVVRKQKENKEEYFLVDGYNIIFAWDELKDLAAVNIDSARGRLLDILCNYQAVKKCSLIAVFDAYRVKGHPTEYLDYHNIHVVYTKEAETADQYIEKFAHENGRKYSVTVATSDHLEQVIIYGQGCRVLSAGDLQKEIRETQEQIRTEVEKQQPGRKQYLLDEVPEEIMRQLRREEESDEDSLRIEQGKAADNNR